MGQRVNLLKNEGRGVLKARNTGVKYSTREYIIFVDSDDSISKDMIRDCIPKVKNHDLLICRYYREYSDIKKTKLLDFPCEITFTKSEISDVLLRRLVGLIESELAYPESLDSLGTVWAKVYIFNIIKENKVQFIDLSLIGSAGDVLFNIHIFKYLNSIVLINKPYYHYWKENGKSITPLQNLMLIEQKKFYNLI